MTEDIQSSNVATAKESDWRLAIAIAILVLAVAGPLMRPTGGVQQASRYALTAAVWDKHTVVLDDYAPFLGVDHAVRDGVIYSDKAPGQPFLAVPFYGLYRLVGGTPFDVPANGVNIGLWWVTVWSAAIPAALLAVLMYRWAREAEHERALAATLTMSFGTLLFVYSTLLFDHVLAAALVFGMFLIIRKPRRTRWELAMAGLLGGVAVAVEYQLALVVTVVTIAAFIRHRRRAMMVVGGGVPVALLLALYNNAITGNPLVTPIQWSGFAGPRDDVNSVLGLFSGPSLERVVHLFFSERGLFFATPVIAMALVGIWLLYRRDRRFDAVVSALAFTAMLAIQGSWSSSYAGGAGPRYLVPALPFLAAPLAVAWSRFRRTTLTLAVISVVTMTAATFTVPQLASDFPAGLGFWLVQVFRGNFAPTVWTELIGGFGWLFYGLLVGVAIFALARATRSVQGSSPPLTEGASVEALERDLA